MFQYCVDERFVKNRNIIMLLYFHNPLADLAFFLAIIVGIIIVIILLLLTFVVGKSRKSNEEKVNPIISELNKNNWRD